jgi:hypothetical protein
MKINPFFKGILYIFVIIYFILILVKMYCWWEGIIFPITFGSNRLLKIYDKVSYLPFIVSSFVLIYSISNKKQKILKISVWVFLILSNSILYMDGDFTNQWYDADSFTVKNKGLIVRQIYDSDLENKHPRIQSFRIVKKENFLSLFSIVKNADTTSAPHINQIWLGTPLK